MHCRWLRFETCVPQHMLVSIPTGRGEEVVKRCVCVCVCVCVCHLQSPPRELHSLQSRQEDHETEPHNIKNSTSIPITM